MPLETLDEWNVRLGQCGCCNMPYCTSDNLRVLTQAKGAQTFLKYSQLSGGIFYRDRRRTYAGGGYDISRWSSDFEVIGVPYTNPTYDVVSTVPPLTGGVISTTYENEITPAQITTIRNASFTAAYSALDWSVGVVFNNITKSSGRIEYDGTQLLSLDFLRFRFRIDPDFEGSYFKFTYDIEFFPEGGGASSMYLEDQVVEWSGPGSGGESDPSWIAPAGLWIEIPPPDWPGTNRIVHIRFSCYRGNFYGVLPQVIAEDSFP
jgi:hypothetical protein